MISIYKYAITMIREQCLIIMEKLEKPVTIYVY